MCILRFFYCGVCAESHELTYLETPSPSDKKTGTPLYELLDTHAFLNIELLHRAARCYETAVPLPDWPNVWPKGWSACPGWVDSVEGEEEMLLSQINKEAFKKFIAFNKAFEVDNEVIHQVKMTLTGKEIKRRSKVHGRLWWTKPWINGTSLAEQERNTPKYDIDQEVYEQKHLVVLGEEVIESLCEILKGLAEKGFRVDPSLVSYGDSTERDNKE
ncbi:hypothetical protein BCON_0904g00020 [Botryotinia convoluta]|uniref:Uncharacterized protein n=1 Tax=Botryotinia convoluta TaxID=54673 RepID=A0A4Z1H5G4_9HELO|nr:hypothetical protein BCON_0904g00020 [Botryotinia convoluta]